MGNFAYTVRLIIKPIPIKTTFYCMVPANKIMSNFTIMDKVAHVSDSSNFEELFINGTNYYVAHHYSRSVVYSGELEEHGNIYIASTNVQPSENDCYKAFIYKNKHIYNAIPNPTEDLEMLHKMLWEV